jgi:hypothetical protein
MQQWQLTRFCRVYLPNAYDLTYHPYDVGCSTLSDPRNTVQVLIASSNTREIDLIA